MGFPVNSPNDDYRVATMGADNPATSIHVDGVVNRKDKFGGISQEMLYEPEHWWSGTGEQMVKGAVGGLGAIAKTLSEVSFNPYGPQHQITADMPQEEQDFWRHKNEAEKPIMADQIKDVQDWARNYDHVLTSPFAKVVGGTTRGLTILGLGSLMGGPEVGAVTLGGTEAYNDYADSIAAGVDENTALKKACLTGAVATAGAFLPMKVSGRAALNLGGLGLQAEIAGNQALASVFYKSATAASLMGGTLVGKLATGAAINTGFGMANRYTTSSILEKAGYDQLAYQYHALDAEAIVADAVLGAAFGGWGHAEEKLNALHRPDRSTVADALEVRREEMIVRGAAGIPTDMTTAGLDVRLQERALGDLIRGRVPEVQPEEALAIVHGSIPDPQRTELHDAWLNAGHEVYGSMADFTEPARVDRPVAPYAVPDTTTTTTTELAPKGPAAAPQAATAGMHPMVEEQMRQLAQRNPDLPVQLPDGRTVKASELPQELAARMAEATKEMKLHEIAVGCLMRTML